MKNPYYVKIDIEHPRKSYCDCPHANGNITCKHMVALYFELFPDEVDDYESWLNSDYEEDDYYNYNDYYDENYYDYGSNSNFEKPLFFDIVLEKFVDDLHIEQLREILLTELKNNEKRTFDLYLKENYRKYLEKNNSSLVFLEELNKRIQDLTGYYSYDYNDYNDYDKEILSVREKRKIEELYKNETLRSQIDKILFNEKLSVYSDYKWIACFYKNNKSSDEIKDYCKILENYLNSLKHYSIKNTVPKSNILIIIYLLSNFTTTDIASSLLKNAKYLQYIDYVVENCNNVIELYSEFMKLINKNYFKNKVYIPEVLYRFVWVTEHENKEINISYYLYNYLCLGHTEYLKILSLNLSSQEIIKLIESKTKDPFLLINLYKFYNKIDKLWNILQNSNYKYLLLDNIDLLKNKYNDDLYNNFVSEFYNILKEDKNREVYHKASKYIKAISKLNDGDNLVDNIISNLKQSEYQKCSALFDEIAKALKNDK